MNYIAFMNNTFSINILSLLIVILIGGVLISYKDRIPTVVKIPSVVVVSAVPPLIVSMAGRGLYGHDPHAYFYVAERAIEEGNIIFDPSSVYGSIVTISHYPIFQIITAIVANVTGLDPIVTAKFIPVVYVLLGILIFYVVTLISSPRIKDPLVVVILYSFFYLSFFLHSQYINESFAFPLFLLSVYIILNKRLKWRPVFLLLVSVAISFTHHFTSMMVITFSLIYSLYYTYLKDSNDIAAVFATVSILPHWIYVYTIPFELSIQTIIQLVHFSKSIFLGVTVEQSSQSAPVGIIDNSGWVILNLLGRVGLLIWTGTVGVLLIIYVAYRWKKIDKDHIFVWGTFSAVAVLPIVIPSFRAKYGFRTATFAIIGVLTYYPLLFRRVPPVIKRMAKIGVIIFIIINIILLPPSILVGYESSPPSRYNAVHTSEDYIVMNTLNNITIHPPCGDAELREIYGNLYQRDVRSSPSCLIEEDLSQDNKIVVLRQQTLSGISTGYRRYAIPIYSGTKPRTNKILSTTNYQVLVPLNQS
jgi:hypothetical protein